MSSRSSTREALPRFSVYVERLSDSERFYRATLQRAEQLGMVEQEVTTLVVATSARGARLQVAGQVVEHG